MHSDLFCVAEVINILKDMACTAESTLHAQQLFGVTGANKMRAPIARKCSFIDWTAANTVFPAAHLILFFFLFFLADEDEPAVRFVALEHGEAVFGE